MQNYDVLELVNFGKINFVRKNHSIPALPEMKLVIFKTEGVYQAICIDLEIDAVGDTENQSCNKLRHALQIYIHQMIDNYNGKVTDAVSEIINIVYGHGNTKSILFNRYLNAKRENILARRENILARVENGKKAASKLDKVVDTIKTVFQYHPIRFDLVLDEKDAA